MYVCYVCIILFSRFIFFVLYLGELMSDSSWNLIPRVRSYLYTNLNWPTIRSVCFRLTWFLFVNLIDLEILVIRKYNSNEITRLEVSIYFVLKYQLKILFLNGQNCCTFQFLCIITFLYFLTERENVFPLNDHLYRRIYTSLVRYWTLINNTYYVKIDH